MSGRPLEVGLVSFQAYRLTGPQDIRAINPTAFGKSSDANLPSKFGSMCRGQLVFIGADCTLIGTLICTISCPSQMDTKRHRPTPWDRGNTLPTSIFRLLAYDCSANQIPSLQANAGRAVWHRIDDVAWSFTRIGTTDFGFGNPGTQRFQ